jgi:hypothetical protein
VSASPKAQGGPTAGAGGQEQVVYSRKGEGSGSSLIKVTTGEATPGVVAVITGSKFCLRRAKLNKFILGPQVKSNCPLFHRTDCSNWSGPQLEFKFKLRQDMLKFCKFIWLAYSPALQLAVAGRARQLSEPSVFKPKNKGSSGGQTLADCLKTSVGTIKLKS